jgi:hypothetical protein
MLMAGINNLAMVRFGGIRVLHSVGEGFALFLIGVAVFGVLIWALSHPDRNESA